MNKPHCCLDVVWLQLGRSPHAWGIQSIGLHCTAVTCLANRRAVSRSGTLSRAQRVSHLPCSARSTAAPLSAGSRQARRQPRRRAGAAGGVRASQRLRRGIIQLALYKPAVDGLGGQGSQEARLTPTLGLKLASGWSPRPLQCLPSPALLPHPPPDEVAHLQPAAARLLQGGGQLKAGSE